MGQRMLGVACVCALFLFVSVPVASATHNTVGKADKSDRYMVTDYSACTVPDVNDPELGGGLNACSASQVSPGVGFGSGGYMRLKIKRVAPNKPIKDKTGENRIPGADDVPPYPFDREANASGDILYSLSASDIVALPSGDPFDGGVGELWTRSSVTDDACPGAGGAPCTTGELLWRVLQWGSASPASTCAAGKCQFTTTANISAHELDPLGFPWGFYWDGTDTANAIVAGNGQNWEEGPICASGDLAGFCQGLLIGTPDGVEPAGFVRPRKATKFKLDLVRHYVGNGLGSSVCTNATTHDPPLSIAECYPSEQASSLDFVSKGKGKLKVLRGRTDTNNEIKIVAVVKKVESSPGVWYNGPASVRFPVRVTHAECAGGVACTRPDVTATVDGTCTNGTCKVKGLTDLKLPMNGYSSVEVGTLAAAGVAAGSPCVYDGASGDGSAKPLACPGTFVP